MFQKGDDARIKVIQGIEMHVMAHGEKSNFVEFRLKEGQTVPEHSHPHEQLGYVVSGSMRLWIGKESQVLFPGDSYAIPADEPHGAEVLQDSVVLDYFTPVREAYL